MKPVLTAAGLSFAYDDEEVLTDITLTVRPGTFTAIVGPNGSGKTTLLKNLLRLLEPDRGVIRIGDTDIRRINRREFAQRAGSVPQNPNLDYDYSVEETVLMGRYPHLKRLQRLDGRDYRIAEEAMRRADILHLRKQRVTRISGGEAQRVVIARALTQEPDLLALDEPTNHLDIRHQVAVLSLLRELCRERGIAVVAILHDLNFAITYSDQVVLLNEGRIHGVGEPEAVLTSESIAAVYRVTAALTADPFTGSPHIVYRID